MKLGKFTILLGSITSILAYGNDAFSMEQKVWKELSEVYTNEEIITAASAAREVFKGQDVGLDIDGPVLVVGDLHGSYTSFTTCTTKYVNLLTELPNLKLVFLGDYVDRGAESVEVITALYKLVAALPNNVFMLRGNHEALATTDGQCLNDFYRGRRLLFNIMGDAFNDNFTENEYKILSEHNEELNNSDSILWKNLGLIAHILYNFQHLPIYAFAGPKENKHFLVHGSIPYGSDKTPIRELRIMKPELEFINGLRTKYIRETEMLWGDPVSFENDNETTRFFNISGFWEEYKSPCEIDGSFDCTTLMERHFRFTRPAAEDFCKLNKVAGIIRAHEYNKIYPFKGTNIVRTIFSAINYSKGKVNTDEVASMLLLSDKQTKETSDTEIHESLTPDFEKIIPTKREEVNAKLQVPQCSVVSAESQRIRTDIAFNLEYQSPVMHDMEGKEELDDPSADTSSSPLLIRENLDDYLDTNGQVFMLKDLLQDKNFYTTSFAKSAFLMLGDKIKIASKNLTMPSNEVRSTIVEQIAKGQQNGDISSKVYYAIAPKAVLSELKTALTRLGW